MIDQLSRWWNQLSPLLELILKSGKPSLILLVNVFILGMAVAYVIWRVKTEVRGLTWNKLSFAERRRIIQALLAEAIEVAEWVYSHIDPDDQSAKEKLAAQKCKTALSYAKTELRAIGAASQDLDTLKLRIEKVIADQNPGKVRFSQAPVETKVNITSQPVGDTSGID